MRARMVALTATDLMVEEVYGFVRHLVGLVNAPYQTYRELSRERCLGHVLPVSGVSLAYLGLAWWLGGRAHPVLVVIAALGTMFLVSLALYWFGRLLGAKASLRAVVSGWSFTYVPTLSWFGMVLALYFIFPPPRTTRFLGQLLSLIFITGSVGLLLWKLLLYYLTLRMTLKLKPARIVYVSAIFLPAFVAYALAMYRLGIFRIPFI